MVNKVFLIRCSGCKWKEFTTGISEDIEHLIEIPDNCPTCGKPRQFRCPNCKGKAKMFRVKGNS